VAAGLFVAGLAARVVVSKVRGESAEQFRERRRKRYIHLLNALDDIHLQFKMKKVDDVDFQRLVERLHEELQESFTWMDHGDDQRVRDFIDILQTASVLVEETEEDRKLDGAETLKITNVQIQRTQAFREHWVKMEVARSELQSRVREAAGFGA
jgi:uncharacterized protein (DUF2249 family)